MSKKLNRNTATPLYIQLEEILRDNIANGVWRPHERIPSENELDKIYGLSRMTVRAVLTQLVRDGLLYRVQGKGTFVSQPKIMTSSPAYMGVREQLEAMGYETTTKLMSIEKRASSSSVREKLRLESGDEVFVVNRVRFVQQQPISLHCSFVPCSLAPELMRYDTENEQLCVILDTRFGLKMGHVTETLESVSATTNEAEFLGVRRRYPLLLLEEIISDHEGRPFEYAKILFRGDRVRLHFEYGR